MGLTLDQARKGQELIIKRIPDGLVRVQAIRFGIMEGTTVVCLEKLPHGPVIIKKGWQEIAMGRRLAASISIAEKIEEKAIKTA